ncbi:MAG TPA: DsbA family protein [Bryobacteraceae bacterium]|nr:DsbA family protein [Bryobacteraceae bacterium]
MRILISLLFVAMLSTAAPVKKKPAVDKTALEAYLRHMELWMPQITVKIDDPKPSPLPGFYEVDVHLSFGKASKDQSYYVSKDGQKIISGTIHDLHQNPFQTDLAKLHTEGQPAYGAANPKVTIVLFSDFECPLCKDEAKSLRENVPKTFPNDVRVYMKDFPLEAIHPWAKSAAIAGRCIYRMNEAAFWDYHDWIYDHQSEITADSLKSKVLEFAKSKNLDTARLENCIDTNATVMDVDRNIAEGRALGIDATPTMFVNGRRLVGQIQWPSMEQIIRFELDYKQKTAATTDEKCCEVTIPSPLKK